MTKSKSNLVEAESRFVFKWHNQDPLCLREVTLLSVSLPIFSAPHRNIDDHILCLYSPLKNSLHKHLPLCHSSTSASNHTVILKVTLLDAFNWRPKTLSHRGTSTEQAKPSPPSSLIVLFLCVFCHRLCVYSTEWPFVVLSQLFVSTWATINRAIMSLEKLSEQQLTRQPEEVFDILCKLGTFICYHHVYKLNQ